MSPELENKLVAEFPGMFRGLHDGDPKETLLCFGLEVGDGWFDLLHKLCTDIQATNPGKDFRAVQVKEKFGGLRFYVTSATKEVHDLIDKAEEKSYSTCEACGAAGVEFESTHGWINTLCSKCMEARR
jgi:hypothetical protein